MTGSFNVPLIGNEYFELGAQGPQGQHIGHTHRGKRSSHPPPMQRPARKTVFSLDSVLELSGLDHEDDAVEDTETHEARLLRHNKMSEAEVDAEFTAVTDEDSPEQAECKRFLAMAKTDKVKDALHKLLHDLAPKKKKSYSVQVAFAFVVLVRGSLNVFLTMAGQQFPTQTLYMLRTPIIALVFTPVKRACLYGN